MSPTLLRRVAVYGALVAAASGFFAARQTLWNRLVLGEPAQAQRRVHVPTVNGALAAYGRQSENKFRPACRKAGIAYPPKRVTLVAFKEEKRVEIWGANRRGPYKRLAVYPVLAASGAAGPKRKSVPEGFYRISALNPASRFHLSLRVNYPNAEDIAHRTVPKEAMGTDIYVHGNAVSIGCLAMGDPAIEEIFCLVARATPGERRILIAPKARALDAHRDRPRQARAPGARVGLQRDHPV